MKELSSFEIDSVCGAGILKDSLTNIGALIGAAVVTTVSQSLTFTVPILGEINLGGILTESVGKNVGSQAGAALGGAIETALSNIPVVGSAINRALGNGLPQ